MDAPDLSEFEALNARKGPACQVGVALPLLDAGQRGKVEAALAAAHITPSAISKWLKQHGFDVTPSAVVHHRKRDCRGCHD